MESTNRWSRVAYRWLMPVALVAAIGVAAVNVISARSDDGGGHFDRQRLSEGEQTSEEKDCKDGNGRVHDSMSAEDLAELVGTDVESLKTALGEGQTLAAIAESNDIAAQDVIDALVAKANERIDDAVEAENLSSEDAETKKSEIASKIEDWANNGFDKSSWRGHGRGHLGSVESG